MKEQNAEIHQSQAIDLPIIYNELLRLGKRLEKIEAGNNLDKPYLTTNEACKYLGVSRTRLWQLVNAGKITQVKKDGKNSYATAELRRYFENPIELENMDNKPIA